MSSGNYKNTCACCRHSWETQGLKRKDPCPNCGKKYTIVSVRVISSGCKSLPPTEAIV